MGILRTLLLKAASLVSVLFVVLFMLVLVLGATGVSDKILNSIAEQALIDIRQSLSKQIHDPEALREAIEAQKESSMLHSASINLGMREFQL